MTKICPICKQLVYYDYYFKAWMCTDEKCSHVENGIGNDTRSEECKHVFEGHEHCMNCGISIGDYTIEKLEKERDKLKLDFESKSLWAETFKKACEQARKERDEAHQQLEDFSVKYDEMLEFKNKASEFAQQQVTDLRAAYEMVRELYKIAQIGLERIGMICVSTESNSEKLRIIMELQHIALSSTPSKETGELVQKERSYKCPICNDRGYYTVGGDCGATTYAVPCACKERGIRE